MHPDFSPILTQILNTLHDEITAENAARAAQTHKDPAGTHLGRHMATGPETAAFLHQLARHLPRPNIVEFGTSFGYATLWLAHAAMQAGGHVWTAELHPPKTERARMTALKAGLDAHITFFAGDGFDLIPSLPPEMDLVFLDHWTNFYLPTVEALTPKLRDGAIIVADNMTRGSKGVNQRAYLAAMRDKPAFDTVTLPIGAGLAISRYTQDQTGNST